MMRTLNQSKKAIVISGILTVISLFIIPVLLPGGNLYSDDIKNLENMVYVTDFKNNVIDFSPILEESDITISGTVSVTATNSNGEIYTVRHAQG